MTLITPGAPRAPITGVLTLEEKVKMQNCCRGFTPDATSSYGCVGLTDGFHPTVYSCLRLIDSCITQLKAQGPSGTCNESKEEEEV